MIKVPRILLGIWSFIEKRRRAVARIGKISKQPERTAGFLLSEERQYAQPLSELDFESLRDTRQQRLQPQGSWINSRWRRR
jgi:hypothetical protein